MKVGSMRISRTRALVGSALAASMIVGIAGTATAQAPSGDAVAPASSAPAGGGAYSDGDVVSFLVFGQGKAAADHPALAQRIRDRRSDASVTGEQLDYLMKKLHSVDPAFGTKVTVPVQSKDPFLVQGGMERLNGDLKQVIAQESNPDTLNSNAIVRPNGWVWTKANIVTVANVAAGINVAAGTNVAVGAEAVVVVVIVPAAASYGFDLQQPNKLDQNDMVAAVAAAL